MQAQLGYLDVCLDDAAKGLQEVQALGSDGANMFVYIAGLQALEGDDAAAIATRNLISDSSSSNSALKAIVDAQIAGHRFSEAMQTIGLFSYPSEQMEELAALRKEQIAQHLGVDSLDTVKRMRALAAGQSDPAEKVGLESDLGSALGETHDSACFPQFLSALQDARALPASRGFDRVSGITNVVEKAEKSCESPLLIDTISQALADARRQAVTLAAGDQNTAYLLVARGYLAAKDTATAWQIENQVPINDTQHYGDQYTKLAQLPSEIAVAEARKGDISSAVQHVHAINVSAFQNQTAVDMFGNKVDPDATLEMDAGDAMTEIAEAYGAGNRSQTLQLLAEADRLYHQAAAGDAMTSVAIVVGGASTLVKDYMSLGEMSAAVDATIKWKNYGALG